MRTTAQVPDEMVHNMSRQLVELFTAADALDRGAFVPCTDDPDAMTATISWVHSGVDDAFYDVQVTVRCRRPGADSDGEARRTSPASLAVDDIDIQRLDTDRMAHRWGAKPARGHPPRLVCLPGGVRGRV